MVPLGTFAHCSFVKHRHPIVIGGLQPRLCPSISYLNSCFLNMFLWQNHTTGHLNNLSPTYRLYRRPLSSVICKPANGHRVGCFELPMAAQEQSAGEALVEAKTFARAYIAMVRHD